MKQVMTVFEWFWKFLNVHTNLEDQMLLGCPKTIYTPVLIGINVLAIGYHPRNL